MPEPNCPRCKGKGTILYFPPRRDGAYPIPCPVCKPVEGTTDGELEIVEGDDDA